MDGHDEGQMGGCFVVEAKSQGSEGVVPRRSRLPFCLADPGEVRIVQICDSPDDEVERVDEERHHHPLGSQ